MLGPYKDFYCFYILINLQHAYKGYRSVRIWSAGKEVDEEQGLTGNTETTSWKRYLVGNCHFTEKPEQLYLLANGSL